MMDFDHSTSCYLEYYVGSILSYNLKLELLFAVDNGFYQGTNLVIVEYCIEDEQAFYPQSPVSDFFGRFLYVTEGRSIRLRSSRVSRNFHLVWDNSQHFHSLSWFINHYHAHALVGSLLRW